MSMAVHGAKCDSLFDSRDLEPRAPGTDRAGCLPGPVGDTDGASGTLPVGFRAPEMDCETVGPLRDIAHVEVDQLAPAQRASEAEQEERPVPAPRPVGI